MKNKGFTLVEVLAVISILGVIIILVMPTMLDTFYRGREMINEYELEDIEDAAKMWIQDYDLAVKYYTYNEDTPYKFDDSVTYNKGDVMKTYHFRVYTINNEIEISIQDLIDGKYYNEDCNYETNESACKVPKDCKIRVGITGEKVENGLYWVTKDYVAKAQKSCE